MDIIFDLITLPFDIISNSLECMMCCGVMVAGTCCLITVVATYLMNPF